MKNIFRFITVCMALGLALACSKTEQPDEQPQLQLASSSAGTTVDEDGLGADVTFSAAGGTVELTVTSNCAWTVEGGTGQWCAAEADNSVLRIVASENGQSLGRVANFKVVASNGAGSVSANVVILQAVAGEDAPVQIDLALEGEDTDVILAAEGDEYRVGVTSAESWTVTPDANWISVEQDETGFTITAGENNTIGIREGSVTIATGEGDNPVVLPVSQFTTSSSAMIIEVTVGSETNNKMALPIDNTSAYINCLVDWGDGSMTRVLAGYPVHQYAEAGVYDISIVGKVSSLRGNDTNGFVPYRDYVTAIKQWGNIGLEQMRYAFAYCSNLRTIAPPAEDSFALLTDIYNCFVGNESLESIPEAMFAGVPLIDTYSAFLGCSSLKEVPARLFAGCSQATRFSMIFKNCSSLTTIAPDAFEGCNPEDGFLQGFYGTAITSFPEGLFKDCTSAENFSFLFGNCTSLTSVPENLFEGLTAVTNLSSLFSGCTSLTSVPDVFTAQMSTVTNISNIFSGCTGLKSVPEDIFSDLTSVTNVSGVFNGCTGLTSIPEGIFRNQTSATTVANVFKGCTGLTSIPENIFSGLTAVTSVSAAFSGCTSLTSIPAGIFREQTANKNISSVFADCVLFESVPDNIFAGMTGVTNISSAFSGCTALKSISAGIFSGMTAVTNLSDVFMNCTSLTSVPEGIFAGMSKVTNCNAAFMGCTSLVSVPVSVFDDCVKVTNFGDTFSGCAALKGESPYTEIDGVKYHLYERGGNDAFSAVRTTAGCFEGCTGLSDYSTIAESYSDWL